MCGRRCRHQFAHNRPHCHMEVDRHSDGGRVGSDRECTELGPSVVTNETHEASTGRELQTGEVRPLTDTHSWEVRSWSCASYSTAGLTCAQFVLLTPLSLLITLDQPVPASSLATGQPEPLTSLLPVPQDHFSPGSSGLKRHLAFVFPWQQTQLKVFSLARCIGATPTLATVSPLQLAMPPLIYLVTPPHLLEQWVD